MEGAAELHALEDRLATMIPRHRHELVRVIPGERVSCLETMVVGPTTAEYAPACVWWWVDAQGEVAYEVGWFDWEVRSTDSHVSHGLVPPNDHRRRGDDGWYRTFADGLAEALIADPRTALTRLLAPGCVVEVVGDGPGADIGAAVSGVHRIEVHEVACDGAVVAILFTAGDDERVSRARSCSHSTGKTAPRVSAPTGDGRWRSEPMRFIRRFISHSLVRSSSILSIS